MIYIVYNCLIINKNHMKKIIDICPDNIKTLKEVAYINDTNVKSLVQEIISKFCLNYKTKK